MAYDFQALIDATASYAMQTGEFENPVPTHEPKSRPGPGVTCSVFVAGIEPIPAASGLNSVTGLVTMNVRVQTPFLQQPADQIDPLIMRAGTAVMALFAANFTFTSLIRNVDLLGAYGQRMRGQLGYLTQDNTTYRVMDILLPLVVNDLFPEAP